MELRYSPVIVWTAVYMLVFLTLFNVYHCVQLIPSDKLCGLHGKPWTPVTKGLEHTWRDFPALTFTTQSKYFGEPFEVADDNWQQLLPDSPIAVGKGHLQSLQIEEGNHQFVHSPRDKTNVLALPEVFIQLGCVNLLRQHINHRLKDNSTYGKNPAFQGSQEDVLHRADLCIERLRETFMCWGDLASILQTLTPVAEGGTPRSNIDLGSSHKCRNFDAVAEWTQENAVKAVRMSDMWWGGRKFY